MNLKFDVPRVGHDLGKSGLGAAYRARVSRLEQKRRILRTPMLSLKMHVLTLRLMLVRCGRFPTATILRKSNEKIRILDKILYKIAHCLTRLSKLRVKLLTCPH